MKQLVFTYSLCTDKMKTGLSPVSQELSGLVFSLGTQKQSRVFLSPATTLGVGGFPHEELIWLDPSCSETETRTVGADLTAPRK